MVNVKDFVNGFVEKKIMNSKINDHAVSDYINKELEIRTYVPFEEKRNAMEMVVQQNIEEVDGIKKNDQIGQYLSFVIAVISLHTNLEWSENPVADYDLLAESGLLPYIIAEFQQDYNECDIILKMALSMELEDNNVNVLIGHFLDGVIKKIDGVSEMFKNVLSNTNLKDILGADINNEDLAKLSGFINKLK